MENQVYEILTNNDEWTKPLPDEIATNEGMMLMVVDLISKALKNMESSSLIIESQFHCDGLTHVGFKCDKQCKRCNELWNESTIME